jgi:adenosylcobinamide-GDP ribazoletransferase
MGAPVAGGGFLGAVTFLTRVPARARLGDDADVARAVPWFPLVGGLIGLAVACLYAVGAEVLPPVVAAGLALGGGLLLTGAFHEDGLGDVADAFGGGATRADVVRILHDPRQGTFGVVATTVSLLVRAGAIASLGPAAALAALPAAHALSRAAAVGLMASVAPSPEEGLGAVYVRALRRGPALAGIASGIAVGTGLIGVWTIPAAALAALATLATGRLARRKLGGISGDVLGATQQLAEIAILCLASAVVVNAWGPLPWWRG